MWFNISEFKKKKEKSLLTKQHIIKSQSFKEGVTEIEGITSHSLW